MKAMLRQLKFFLSGKFLDCYIEPGSTKFYHVRTFFARDWAQKTSLTKLVLKNSVWMQSLPNFFCQVNSWIAILRQHKILLRSNLFISEPKVYRGVFSTCATDLNFGT